MKLLFPNGEHVQVLLNSGGTRIGADKDCHVVLAQPGVAALHCEILLAAPSGPATLRLGEAAGVAINGTPAEDGATLRPGDLLAFAGVQARLVAVEQAGAPAAPRPQVSEDATTRVRQALPASAGPRRATSADDGATRVRQALPRFVLRGVSGAAFNKTYPVTGLTVIGRQSDCDISIPSEELSRRHASVKPTQDGLMVEDLGSSNGTFINNKRVQSGLLSPGDELRLDNLRFMLVAPGQEMPAAAKATPGAEPAAAARSPLVPVLIGAAVVVLGLAAWWLMR